MPTSATRNSFRTNPVDSRWCGQGCEAVVGAPRLSKVVARRSWRIRRCRRRSRNTRRIHHYFGGATASGGNVCRRQQVYVKRQIIAGTPRSGRHRVFHSATVAQTPARVTLCVAGSTGLTRLSSAAEGDGEEEIRAVGGEDATERCSAVFFRPCLTLAE